MTKQHRTSAVHVRSEDGTKHIVGISDLQVLITQCEDHWFAQGIEIDYGAEGKNLDDVRRSFEYGLAATISAHLKEFQTIERLLRPAPEFVRQRIASGIANRYSQLSRHLFPFRIEFLEAA